MTDSPPKIQRAAKWLLFLLLVATAAWWTLRHPFDEQKLRRAIPSNATLIAEIDAPGPRWERISANPFVATVLPDGTNAPSTNAISNAQIGTWVRWFAPREVLLAYVPAYEFTGKPAWIAVSWAGHRAQLLRWALSMNLVPGFRSERADNGHAYWVLRLRNSAMPFLSLDISDGIILACLSHQPDGIRHIVRRLEFRTPEAPLFLSMPTSPMADATTLVARAVLAATENPQAPEAMISATLTAFDASRIAGVATWHHPAPVALAPAPASASAPTIDWLGPDACLTLLLPTATNRPLDWIESSLTPPWRAAISCLDRTAAPNATLFVSLLGGECSGRMLGVRVPTIIAGMQCAPSTDITHPLSLGLDILNKTHTWGLVPLRRDVAGIPVFTVQSSRDCLLSSLDNHEQPALTVYRDWLIFCSNADILERLITAGPPPSTGTQPPLFRQNGEARLWLDFTRTSQCLRNALAAYELSLLTREENPESRAARRSIDRTRSWIESFSTFSVGEATIRSNPSGIQLDYEIRR